MASACDYSIYEGMTHRTAIDYVFSAGRMIARQGEFLGERGQGRFLPRAINQTLAASTLEEV